MRILVTGGAGFIGSHIVEHFHATDEVIVLDNLRSGFRKNLEGFRLQFVEGSVEELDLVRRCMDGVDYVFHLAALVSVPESMERIQETVAINVQGTLNVFQAAREARARKVVVSSSAAIYGDNPIVPKLESMLPEPRSPYAITKLDDEFYGALFTRDFGLPVACLRYFNVFGPRQNPKSQYAAAVPIFIARALQNETITIHGDGEQTRDFVYVKDVVAANVLAGRGPMTGVFNIACGRSISIKNLAALICSLTGSSSPVEHGPERAGDVKYSRAEVEKALAAGFQPHYSLEEGLAETIGWFRSLGPA